MSLVLVEFTEKKYYHISLFYYWSCLHHAFDLLFTILPIWCLQLLSVKEIKYLVQICGILLLLPGLSQNRLLKLPLSRYLANRNSIFGTSIRWSSSNILTAVWKDPGANVTRQVGSYALMIPAQITQLRDQTRQWITLQTGNHSGTVHIMDFTTEPSRR